MKPLLIVFSALLLACSAEPGRDGRDGEDGKQGEQGITGRSGDPGRDGNQGPAGPAVPLSKAKMSQRLSSATIVSPSSAVTVGASCALASDVLLSGGCITTGGGTNVSATYPRDAADPGVPSAWICTARNVWGGGSENAGSLIAYAVCVTP